MEMEFTQFIKEVYRKFGINLAGYKEKQLKRRIDSLVKGVGLHNYQDYLNLLSKDNKQWKIFLDKVTINVSEFFRNPDIFTKFEKSIIPELCRDKKKLNIWSAACSNGAEPYSIAIIMEDNKFNTDYEIFGTDMDENILKIAKSGMYEPRLVKNVSSHRLKKFFTLDGDKHYILDPKLKKKVRFKKHDLLVDKYGSDYDLIVCRNVTIYFTRETQEKIHYNMNRSLRMGGILFIGATENIMRYKELGFEKISHWFYRKIKHLG